MDKKTIDTGREIQRSKSEVLADLYALRAGLGLISEEIEKIEKIEGVISLIEEAPEEQERKKGILEQKEEEYKRIEENIKIQKNTVNTEIVEVRANRWSEKKVRVENFEEYAVTKAKAENRVFLIWAIITGIFGAMLNIIILIVGFSAIASKEAESSGAFLSIFWNFPLIVPSLILSIKYKCKKKDSITWSMSELRMSYAEALKEQKKVEEKIRELEEYRDRKKQECRIAHERYLEAVENFSIHKETKQKYEQEGGIPGCLKNIECVETALHNVYDAWLDARDWENVDLIIYYFETGRVDSVKEALWHVDRRKQTDEIVNAIYEANASIGAAIERSMMKLGERLAKSFSVISSQISEVAKLQYENLKMTEKVKQSNEQSMKSLEEKLSKQIEEMDLNNALLNNIEKSSNDIMEEWYYCKQKYSL